MGRKSRKRPEAPETPKKEHEIVSELPPDKAPDTYEALEEATKRNSFLDRVNTAFHDVLHNSRGSNRQANAVREAGNRPDVNLDDLAIRRAKNVKPQRLTVPEGVIVDGSLSSANETEIEGKVQGDVHVEGGLYLGASALISGNVRSTQCRVEGLVEGKMECSQDIELGSSGRLNADVLAGKRIVVSGQIFGNVYSGGLLHLTSTAKITGDVFAKKIVIEDGAVLNGRCSMRKPAIKEQQKERSKQ